MKFIAILALIGMTSTPAFAGGPVYRGNGTVRYEEKCYKNVEKYIPGYYDDFGNWRNGRVKTTRKKISCGRLYERPRFVPQTTPHYHYEEQHPNVGNVDNNSCAEGTVAGGLLGGALGGVLSKKENWIWSIPTGIVGGAMVGCQVDGG